MLLAIQTIQDVKDLNILDVVSNYVSLKKESYIYKGVCPFHNEKSPSFTVNPAKGIFKCFGCGAGGDAIKFVMLHEKLEFISAIERMANDHKIQIIYEQQTEDQKKKEEEKKTLFDATNYAQKYFKQLLSSKKEALQYLKDRAIEKDDINKWQLGWADGTNYLSKYSADVAQQNLYRKASLISSNAEGKVHYDFYQNRITIPIVDAQKRIISFAGRTIANEEPKYKNGRETDIFSKSKILFGVNNYKRPYAKCNYSVLVEGYLDVISLHKIGCTNSLASNGTALSREQAKILKKFGDWVVYFYDNDIKNQGLNSFIKNIDILLEEGLKVKVYVSWIGKDADDFASDWYKNHPNQSIAIQLFEAAMDGVEFKANYLVRNATTPGEISDAKNAISETLYKIKDETLRSEYIKYVSKNLLIKEKELSSIVKTIDETNKKKAQEARNKETKFLDENYPDWYDKEHQKHVSKFQFTQLIDKELTGYYFPDNTWQPIQASNFVIEPLYTIKTVTNPRRMCEVFGYNRLTNRMISEVLDFDEKQLLNRMQFESRLAMQSPFITLDSYTNGNHKRLINKLLFQFKDCYELTTLGSQPEQFWAFSNVCFEFPNKENPKGKEQNYNDFGVVEIGETNFLSEAKNKRVAQIRSDNNNPYENDLYFIYKKSDIDFSQWADLLDKVYSSEKAWLAISFSITTIFRDIVLNFTKIPHLHCYGEKGSGKSQFAESIFHLFFSGKDSEGKLYKPFNLAGGGTPYSFHNRLERFRSVPQILNEYDDTNILPEFFDAIKASFDGEGRERGMGVKGKTETMRRNATLILVGQKIGNRDDNSVLTRSVTIDFLKKDYTEEARALLSELEKHELNGLSSLIIDLLSHRIHFKQRFTELYLKTVTELQKKVAAIYQKVETRIVKSLAALQLSYLVIAEVIPLPLNAEQLSKHVFDKAIEMHAHLQSTDGLSEFWKVIEFLMDKDEVEEGWDFKIKPSTNVKLRKTVDGHNKDEIIHFTGEKKLLFIRLGQLHQFYSLHVNRTGSGQKPLSEKTIQTYMSSQAYYLGLCPGTGFKSKLKNKSKDSTSCYVLDYEMIGINLESSAFEDERTEETIDGIITKLHEVSGDKVKFTVKTIITVKSEPVDKSLEQYTNCFIAQNDILIGLVKEHATIKIKGFVSINTKGYRNMDVTQIIHDELIKQEPEKTNEQFEIF